VTTHVAECLLDIALVIDCSGSIRATSPPGVDNWQYVIDFMVNVVSSLNVGKTRATHVGVVTFGTYTRCRTLSICRYRLTIIPWLPLLFYCFIKFTTLHTDTAYATFMSRILI